MPAGNSSARLSLSDVRFRYTAREPDVLQIPQLDIADGKFISLLGASGSGKSTLLRLVAGLLQPAQGTIHMDVRQQHDVGMVFQSANLIPWRTARQNVSLPAELGAHARTVDEAVLDELFQLVGLQTQHTQKRSSELSGGMQMRVSIARALVMRPSMLLLDEPFAALDDLLRMQLEEDVRRIHHERQLTTVLVTHNISEAVFMSDRVLVFGGQPSTIRADIDVPLPANRSRQLRSDSQFHQLVDIVTEALHSASDAEMSPGDEEPR